MSPKDRLSRVREVLADYFAIGVTHIRLIDPLKRLTYVFDARGLTLQESNHFRVVDTPIAIDVGSYFIRLDRKR